MSCVGRGRANAQRRARGTGRFDTRSRRDGHDEGHRQHRLLLEVPWRVSFFSSNPDVALVDGLFESPALSADIAVTGVAPGSAVVLSPMKSNGTWPLATITVSCSGPGSVTPVSSLVSTQTVHPVLLAVNTEPQFGWTFSWYRGRAGETAEPIFGAGPAIVFVPAGFGTHHVWVLASGPCSSSSVEFTVVVRPPRRRAVR